MTPYKMSPVGLDIATLPCVPWAERQRLPRGVVYFLLKPPYARAALAYMARG